MDSDDYSAMADAAYQEWRSEENQEKAIAEALSRYKSALIAHLKEQSGDWAFTDGFEAAIAIIETWGPSGDE